MGHLNRTTSVACPPSKVFDVLSDVDRLTEFSEMTVAIRNGPGRALQTGDHFEQVVKVLGKELESEWDVVDVQEPSLLHLEGTAPGGAKATLIERITAEGDGSRVELDVEYDMPLGILGDAIDSMYLHSKNEEKADEILAKLKVLCEGS